MVLGRHQAGQFRGGDPAAFEPLPGRFKQVSGRAVDGDAPVVLRQENNGMFAEIFECQVWSKMAERAGLQAIDRMFRRLARQWGSGIEHVLRVAAFVVARGGFR